ncbi:hypothetical protein TNCV_3483021 [Trichonephila clavipes]|nr:hypothetical protein TNCV_3483021 [Trichonephila clavipes]
MLEKIIENWTSRLDYIRASRGSPMPEIIFKMEKLRSLFSDTLAYDRVTGVNSSDSSSSLSVLLWSKAPISASDRAPHTAMSVSTNT